MGVREPVLGSNFLALLIFVQGITPSAAIAHGCGGTENVCSTARDSKRTATASTTTLDSCNKAHYLSQVQVRTTSLYGHQSYCTLSPEP